MLGASDQNILAFKPRNEHRHYGNTWVTDYQKHNSEKLIKCWHVKMHKEKKKHTTGNIWKELISKYSKTLIKNILWKKSYLETPNKHVYLIYVSISLGILTELVRIANKCKAPFVSFYEIHRWTVCSLSSFLFTDIAVDKWH